MRTDNSQNFDSTNFEDNRNQADSGFGGSVRTYGMGRGGSAPVGTSSTTSESLQGVNQGYPSHDYPSQTTSHQAILAYHMPAEQHMYSPQMSKPSTYAQTQGSSEQKRKRGVGFWIAIIVALIAVVIALLLALQMCEGKGPLRDPNQASGQLEGKTEEEIQAELNRVVEEGMFNISIASVVEFETGTSEGDIRIENVPGNRYLMQVDITDDTTGDILYSSGVIEPNHHIQKAPLDVDLDAGSYSCTAVFHALDPEDETEIGQAAAKVTINVLG